MKDYYTTRESERSSIIERKDPPIYGNLLIQSLFTLSEIEVIRKIALSTPGYDVMEPGNTTNIRSRLNVHSDELIAACKLKQIRELLMPEGYIHQSRINFKNGKESTGWHWHSDFETWHYQDGMPRPDCFTVMIALDDNTDENGCLKVIPGSHRWYVSTKKGSDSGAVDNFQNQVDGVVQPEDISRILGLTGTKIENVICSKGDVFIFDSNLLHKSNKNRTNGTRANLFVVINSVNNKLIDLNNPRPEEMGHRKNLRMI